MLLSGGLDCATVLAIARERGIACHALSFDYGQRHAAELAAARRIAAASEVTSHHIVSVALDQFGGSALTDSRLQIPNQAAGGVIPVTYVPARNTVFLSLALAQAEALGIRDIFIGVNAVDYSGYPDCRPEFIAAFERLANVATKAGVEGRQFRIHAPLIQMAKADIIRRGAELGVDYALTVSCYQADESGAACKVCEACRLRARGFQDAGVADPTRYA